MKQALHEIAVLLSKSAIYIIVVVLAIMGKIGLDIVNKKKISTLYILGFSMLAIFVSVMVYLICQFYKVNGTASAIYVGASAMFSRDIMVVATTMKWNRLTQLNWKDVILMLTDTKKDK